jgi:hypothetical protein
VKRHRVHRETQHTDTPGYSHAPSSSRSSKQTQTHTKERGTSDIIMASARKENSESPWTHSLQNIAAARGRRCTKFTSRPRYGPRSTVLAALDRARPCSTLYSLQSTITLVNGNVYGGCNIFQKVGRKNTTTCWALPLQLLFSSTEMGVPIQANSVVGTSL